MSPNKLQYELCAQSILGNLDTVDSLFHAGAEPFDRVGGCGALCYAAFYDHQNIVLKIVCFWSSYTTDLTIYQEPNVAEMIDLALFLAQMKKNQFIANYLKDIHTHICKSQTFCTQKKLNFDLVLQCGLGDIMAVKRLLNDGADPCYQHGIPLMFAISNRHDCVVSCLMKHDAYHANQSIFEMALHLANRLHNDRLCFYIENIIKNQ